MTKFIITLALALVPTLFFGQSVFDKFDGQDDITSVVVNKKAFEMLGEIKTDVKEKEVAKYMKMADKIDNFRMFSTSSIKKAAEMKTAFETYRKKEALEQLVKVNDKGKNVQIYMKSGNSSSKVKELLMFIEGGDQKGDETVLISLTGDIDLSNLEGLSR